MIVVRHIVVIVCRGYHLAVSVVFFRSIEARNGIHGLATINFVLYDACLSRIVASG